MTGIAACIVAAGAATEPEPREAEVADYLKRLPGLPRAGTIGGQELLDNAQKAPRSLADRVLHRERNGVLPLRGAARQKLQQVAAGQLLADVLKPDPQRIESPLLGLRAGQLEHLQPVGQLGQVLPPVVGLRIEVHHERSPALGCVLDRLRGDRLARPEGADQKDR